MHHSIDSAPPGSVVSVQVQVGPAWFSHVGVLAEYATWGERTILSNSRRRGGGTEETASSFAEGQQVTLVKLAPPGRGAEIVARARRLLARQVSWSIADNCEHFVSRAYGETPSSPQLRQAITALGSLAVVGALFGFGLSGFKG